MSLSRKISNAHRARDWTRDLRRDIDSRSGSRSSVGALVLGDVDRHEAAAVAGDALESGRSEAEVASLLADVAPIVLSGVTYRVICSVRRPSGNTHMTLLGPRGGVTTLHHTTGRHADQPIAWHASATKRGRGTWYHVNPDGSYTKMYDGSSQ